MTVSQKGELIFFAVSFLLGLANGVLYDVFRFFRMLLGVRKAQAKPQKQNKSKLSLSDIVTFFLDFLYVLLFGALYILFLYEIHSGVFRAYSLLAMGLGALLYFKTVSRVILFLLVPTVLFLRRVGYATLYPFGKIFRFVFGTFLKLLRKMRCFSHKIVLKYKRKEKKKKQIKTQAKVEKNTAATGIYTFGKQ